MNRLKVNELGLELDGMYAERKANNEIYFYVGAWRPEGVQSGAGSVENNEPKEYLTFVADPLTFRGLPLSTKRVPEEDSICTITDEMASGLMDNLWDMGVRPGPDRCRVDEATNILLSEISGQCF